MNQSSRSGFLRMCVSVASSAWLVMLAACAGGVGSSSAAPNLGAPSETSAGSPTSLDVPVTQARHVTAYDASFAGSLAVQHRPDRLWSGSRTNLGWLDPRTGTTHVVDAVPGVMLAVYDDALYRAALYQDEVARYDVSGTPREVARQPAPSPLNLLAGPHGVWAADHFHGNLLRLDPETLKVLEKVPIGTGNGFGPAGMLWQGQNMWVNVMRDRSVALVDGRTGRVLHRVHLGGTNLADGISRTSAGIWTKAFQGHGAATLKLVDTKLFRVISHLNVTDAGQVFTPVEIRGETWMLDGDKLWHLAPDHDWRPDRALDLQIPGLHAGFELVAFGSLWITTSHPERIIRIGAHDLD